VYDCPIEPRFLQLSHSCTRHSQSCNSEHHNTQTYSLHSYGLHTNVVLDASSAAVMPGLTPQSALTLGRAGLQLCLCLNWFFVCVDRQNWSRWAFHTETTCLLVRSTGQPQTRVQLQGLTQGLTQGPCEPRRGNSQGAALHCRSAKKLLCCTYSAHVVHQHPDLLKDTTVPAADHTPLWHPICRHSKRLLKITTG
jgi:hypothetical protein